jgi:single-strand DNA-binding protein
MSDINKAILVGRIGNDIELKYTTSGDPVCNIRLATNENYTDKSGTKVENTTWHNITTFGKTAELCGKYLAKGRKIYVEGSIRTRKYTDKQGVEKTATEIRATDVKFMDSNPNHNQQAGE